MRCNIRTASAASVQATHVRHSRRRSIPKLVIHLVRIVRRLISAYLTRVILRTHPLKVKMILVIALVPSSFMSPPIKLRRLIPHASVDSGE